MLRAGADPNVEDTEEDTAIFHLLSQDRRSYTHGNKESPEMLMESLEALIAAGANLDAASKRGETVLMRAVRLGWLWAVKLLLAGGVDPYNRNPEGKTALMVAAKPRYNSIESTCSIMTMLLDAGAGPHHVNVRGESALMHVFSGFELFSDFSWNVWVLLDAGAEDQNAGQCPAHNRRFACPKSSPKHLVIQTKRGHGA